MSKKENKPSGSYPRQTAAYPTASYPAQQAPPAYPGYSNPPPMHGQPGYQPQPGYPPQSGYLPHNPPPYQPQQPYAPPQQPSTVVVQGGFDAGARFDVTGPSLPPPPPGVAPTVGQVAAAQGQNVVVTQRKGNFVSGGSDGGMVIW